MKRWRGVWIGWSLWLLGTATVASAAGRLHLYVGVGGGAFSLTRAEVASDWQTTLATTIALEYTLWSTVVDVRLGGSLDVLSGRATTAVPVRLTDASQYGIGVYVKGKLALVYAGIGLQSVRVEVTPGPVAPPETVHGLFPFQIVGLELRIALVSLGLEYQHVSGTFSDLLNRGDHVYRRHLVRAVAGLHW